MQGSEVFSVFAEDPLVRKHLTSPFFKCISFKSSSPQEGGEEHENNGKTFVFPSTTEAFLHSDILWLLTPLSGDLRSCLSPGQRVNQIPFESSLVNKANLYRTVEAFRESLYQEHGLRMRRWMKPSFSLSIPSERDAFAVACDKAAQKTVTQTILSDSETTLIESQNVEQTEPPLAHQHEHQREQQNEQQGEQGIEQQHTSQQGEEEPRSPLQDGSGSIEILSSRVNNQLNIAEHTDSPSRIVQHSNNTGGSSDAGVGHIASPATHNYWILKPNDLAHSRGVRVVQSVEEALCVAEEGRTVGICVGGCVQKREKNGNETSEDVGVKDSQAAGDSSSSSSSTTTTTTTTTSTTTTTTTTTTTVIMRPTSSSRSSSRPSCSCYPASSLCSSSSLSSTTAASTLSRKRKVDYLAQKYVSDPLLFEGKKFDMRFTVLVKNPNSGAKAQEIKNNNCDEMTPCIYVYRGFRVRVAQKEFTLDPSFLSDLGVHLTYQTALTGVHGEGDDLDDLKFVQRLVEWQRSALGVTLDWPTILQRIHRMLFHTVRAAYRLYPQMLNEVPEGVAAVASYGADVIVDARGFPYLLEFSFAPDTTTKAELYPMLWNDIFETLFLGQQQRQQQQQEQERQHPQPRPQQPQQEQQQLPEEKQRAFEQDGVSSLCDGRVLHLCGYSNMNVEEDYEE